MKKGIVALICMILTLVFILVALVGTWYGGHGEEDVAGTKVTVDYSMSLTGGEVKAEGEGQKITEEIKYDDDFDAKYVFDNTMYITIIALIIAIIALICILGMTFAFGNIKNMKMLGSIFGILTVIFTLIAPLYFMTALPLETKDVEGNTYNFWDEIELFGVKVSMGPGYAWYLMLVSFVFALIASIVVFMEKPSTPMATMSPQQPQQPQQPPQQPKPPQ